ncbi:phosphoenolpyruvate--protein phosphotransferase [Actinoalloteichus sp. AHMU CJ021]|uniref:phosphoenolpyruvate--protein phosphotransferase n=2 Tax=Pseudonocardiaceae TaxID=2070 RepID=UPI0004C0B52E|nr:putative PEP-binding protein [Actinoalloteichus caeruleus]AUS80217.1 phosphoenolpyruvate--protein phosphotransferase [Actinoalloteichus sp. AHMU CJ021]
MAEVVLNGVGVSPGRAAGPVVRITEPVLDPPAGPPPVDPTAEAARIRPAGAAVAGRLRAQAARAEGESAEVLETTAVMAEDPSLLGKAEQLVASGPLPAARAVHEAAEEFVTALRAAGGYMAERARDVIDVRDRLVTELLGRAAPGIPVLDQPSVLLARDLAPADTAGLDPSVVLALVTEEGGPTSHTAILARSLGIPAVVACQGVLELDPAALVVDGGLGTVVEAAPEVTVVTADRPPEAHWDGVGRTSDGHQVALLANVGSAPDSAEAVRAGAEGVGLFRTEFCYLGATREPSAQDQHEAYRRVLAPFRGKPVVVRTLDAGADKPIPFLDQHGEPNPALGVRGLRLGRVHEDVLDRQLGAIVAAATDSGAVVSVMAPMVATPAEAAWFAARARAAGVERVGVMVEVPSAVLTADEILDVVDFVSVGTNDLAQYTLAADRQLGAVAQLTDPWQPGLLRLLRLLGRSAGAAGKPVGVCGEAAADPDLAAVLVGLGVSSLSMNHPALAPVGARLAGVDLARCRAAAEAALAAAEPSAARAAARLELARR